MKVLLIIIGVSILVLNIWNIITLRQIKKKSTQKDSQLNDSKYFELKSKSEFIIAVFSVIVAGGGYLGYNSLQSVESERKSELLNKTKKIDSTLNETNKKVLQKDSMIAQLELKLDVLSASIPQNEKLIQFQKYELSKLQNVINELNNSNKAKQSFYIVRDLKIPNSKNSNVKYFRFKDLKTNLKDKLPVFDNKPIVIPIPKSTADIQIYNISLEGFYAGVASSTTWDDDNEPSEFIFHLMIIDNK